MPKGLLPFSNVNNAETGTCLFSMVYVRCVWCYLHQIYTFLLMFIEATISKLTNLQLTNPRTHK